MTMDEALSRLEAFIKSGEPHVVVTADSSGIVEARKDAEFLAILHSADLVTADSVGVIWAAKRKGEPVPERVSGVDIFARLCRMSAERGYRLYFLGGAPGVAEMAAERCRLLFPGCNIVGARHGYFPSDSDELVAQEVAEAKPDVLFVAMGMPRQEKFITSTQKIIKAPVAMGVGGTLDVYSGTVKRAPRLIQKMKLEWLWRLIQNPKKFAKVKNLPIFVRMVLRSRD
jgi:N-acetylglucosaminyldiphosphoundecaprenol N-acetyl-beta-D-mannosaminyltransferase